MPTINTNSPIPFDPEKFPGGNKSNESSQSDRKLLGAPSTESLGRSSNSPNSLAARVTFPAKIKEESPSPLSDLMPKEGFSPSPERKSSPLSENNQDLAVVLDKSSYRESELALDAKMDDAYIKLSAERQKLYDALALLVSPRVEELKKKGIQLKTPQLYLSPSERSQVHESINSFSDSKLENLIIDMKSERERLRKSPSELTFTHLLRLLKGHL